MARSLCADLAQPMNVGKESIPSNRGDLSHHNESANAQLDRSANACLVRHLTPAFPTYPFQHVTSGKGLPGGGRRDTLEDSILAMRSIDILRVSALGNVSPPGRKTEFSRPSSPIVAPAVREVRDRWPPSLL